MGFKKILVDRSALPPTSYDYVVHLNYILCKLDVILYNKYRYKEIFLKIIITYNLIILLCLNLTETPLFTLTIKLIKTKFLI